MPVCSIKNCKSRTGRNNKENYNVLLFYFPKEPELRKQWLEACQRKETDINVSCAAVCEQHFMPDCIEERWTQQRSKNQPRVIRKLKRGSIPIQLLNIPKKHKSINEREQTKSGHEDLSIELAEAMDIAEQLNSQNKINEILLEQLKKLEKENEQLIGENTQPSAKNTQLSVANTQLSAANTQISTAMKYFVKENEHLKKDAIKNLHEF